MPIPIGILAAQIAAGGGFQYWFAIQDFGDSGNRGQIHVDSNGLIYTAFANGVTVLNPDSTLNWSRQFTSLQPFGLHVDSTKILVPGQWGEEVGIGRFNLDGTHVATRRTARGGNNYDATFTGDNNYYAAGNVSFNGPQAFISKFNNSNVLQWQYGFQNVGQNAWSIAHDSSDAIYFSHPMFNTNTGDNDHAITKLDQSGNEVWSRRIEPNNSGNGGIPPFIHMTADNRIYLHGSASQSGSSSNYTNFTRIDTSGNWQTDTGGFNVGQSSKVGFWYDPVNGDKYLASGVGNGAFWIFKLNSSNVVQWQRQITGAVFGGNITLDGVYLTGDANALYFSNTIEYNGNRRLFIGKLPKDGNFTGSYDLGATTLTVSASSATFTANNLSARTNFTMTRSDFGFTNDSQTTTVTAITPTYFVDGV